MSNSEFIAARGRAAALDRNITPLPELHDCAAVDAHLRDAMALIAELEEEINRLDAELAGA